MSREPYDPQESVAESLRSIANDLRDLTDIVTVLAAFKFEGRKAAASMLADVKDRRKADRP